MRLEIVYRTLVLQFRIEYFKMTLFYDRPIFDEIRGGVVTPFYICAADMNSMYLMITKMLEDTVSLISLSLSFPVP